MTRRRISSRLSPTDPVSQRRLTFARRVHAERRIRSTLLMSNRVRPSVCLALPHLVGEPIYATISEQPCEIYRRLRSTKRPARRLFTIGACETFGNQADRLYLFDKFSIVIME